MSNQPALPIWARPEALPVKPQIGSFGFQRDNGEREAFENPRFLEDACAAEEQYPQLVWTPESPHLIVVEECAELRDSFLELSRQRVGARAAKLRRMSALLALVVAGAFVMEVSSAVTWSAALTSPLVLFTLIPWLFYVLLPWYNCSKFLRQAAQPDADFWEKEVADARFEYWLKLQKAPITQLLSGLMIVLGAIQFVMSGGIDWAQHAVATVALTKQSGAPFWQYLTGPMAHGHLIHWLMNFYALRYLAKRMEVLVGWQHMLWVLVFSAYAGAVATVKYLPQTPSVGISGGLLGILGFLIAFETRHKKLVPKSPRRRLAAALLSITLLGILGFQFVDNAAHAGGLLAGAFYGIAVFPSSTSVQRPDLLKRDQVIGFIALAVLLTASVTCAVKLL